MHIDFVNVGFADVPFFIVILILASVDSSAWVSPAGLSATPYSPAALSMKGCAALASSSSCLSSASLGQLA